METDELIEQTLAAWRRHDEILRSLLDAVPRDGWRAVPTGSRGRDVARQFAHLDRVRRGWVHMHRTGKRPKTPRVHKGEPPTKAQVKKALRESGKEVETFLGEALRGEVRPRQFGRQVMRWMAYLISHESHHRGQICLALKQSDLRLSEKVAIQGLWGKWIMGS